MHLARLCGVPRTSRIFACATKIPSRKDLHVVASEWQVSISPVSFPATAVNLGAAESVVEEPSWQSNNFD
jgi:hypothetical protein